MKVTEFKAGLYYIEPEWEGTGMCITIGEDFKYKFGILKNNIFNLLDSNYIPDLFKNYKCIN